MAFMLPAPEWICPCAAGNVISLSVGNISQLCSVSSSKYFDLSGWVALNVAFGSNAPFRRWVPSFQGLGHPWTCSNSCRLSPLNNTSTDLPHASSDLGTAFAPMYE